MEGSAYIFTGKWDTWTQLQQLIPPEKHRYSDFGKILDVDTVSLSSAVVGCPFCNDTKWAGQIYVYSPDPLKDGDTALSHTWSQTQVLITDYYDFYTDPDKVAFFLGSKVKVHGDVILGMSQMYPHLSALVYVRNTDSGLWSYQQALRLDDSVSDFAVYHDTIVLTSTSQSVEGVAEAGAAFVYYPNTNDYFVPSNTRRLSTDSKAEGISGTRRIPNIDKDEYQIRVNPSPKSTHWSQHQVLYGSTIAASNNFGSDISLQNNYMVIGEQGTSKVYIFRRSGILGSYWSHAQVLIPTASSVEYFSRSFFHGNSLVVAGIIDTQTHLEIFSSSTDWKCLVVQVLDKFGDGWEESQLEVATPVENSYDYFAPLCNYPNPFTFRYCPNNPEDAGVYEFSIPDGILSKYHWEMQFQIYEEKSRQWYHGDSSTVMSFNFNSTDLSFSYESGRNMLPSSDSCTQCPVTTPFPSWAHLEVNMTSENGYDWFQESYQGTSYSISDANGRRQLVSGRMCDTSSQGSIAHYSCWHVLVNGKYTFRVSGDLNDNSGSESMSWSFCNVTGSESIHMYFEIKDSKCIVIAQYTLQAFCNPQLNALSTVLLSVDLENTAFLSSLSEVAAADRAAFSTTLAKYATYFSPKDIKFLNAFSRSAFVDDSVINITTFEMEIILNLRSSGHDARDLTSMTMLADNTVSVLNDIIARNTQLYEELKSTSIYNSTYFQRISAVTLVRIDTSENIKVITPVQLYPYSTEVTADGSTFTNTL